MNALKHFFTYSAIILTCMGFSTEDKQYLDYANPLWEVDQSSSHERVKEIEQRLQAIGKVLRDNFENEDPDVETILFYIEQIRFALYGFHATYGVRLP